LQVAAAVAACPLGGMTGFLVVVVLVVTVLQFQVKHQEAEQPQKVHFRLIPVHTQ